jgi:hypothetical protein
MWVATPPSCDFSFTAPIGFNRHTKGQIHEAVRCKWETGKPMIGEITNEAMKRRGEKDYAPRFAFAKRGAFRISDYEAAGGSRVAAISSCQRWYGGKQQGL